jgi:hypothetical protein
MAFSRDALHFDRLFMEAFIRPGPDPLNWGHAHGNNTPAWGLVQTSPAEISLYWAEHSGGVPQLRRGVVRTDGFVSVQADYSGGRMTTRPLVFAGRQLKINYATSAIGGVRVELLRADGTPIEGFRRDDCREIFGDEIERLVTWGQTSEISRFQGEPARLRFHLKDADLCSFRFAD